MINEGSSLSADMYQEALKYSRDDLLSKEKIDKCLS